MSGRVAADRIVLHSPGSQLVPYLTWNSHLTIVNYSYKFDYLFLAPSDVSVYTILDVLFDDIETDILTPLVLKKLTSYLKRTQKWKDYSEPIE